MVVIMSPKRMCYPRPPPWSLVASCSVAVGGGIVRTCSRSFEHPLLASGAPQTGKEQWRVIYTTLEQLWAL
jgi:hypothetical protein